jgi:hypothetical protein
MPVWLTPRVRLGVTASLIALITCGLLVTPYLFHDDAAGTSDSLTSVNASIDLHTVPPPPSRKPPIVLPHLVLSEPDSTLPPQSLRQSARNGGGLASTGSTQGAQSTQGDQQADPVSTAQAAQDSTTYSAGPSYSLASDGSSSGGAAPSAATGSLAPPSVGGVGGDAGGTRVGSPKQQQPVPLGYGSGGSPAPVSIPPVVPPPVIQPVVLPPNGSVNGDFSGPPPTDPPPPIDPPVVQVPEPTSFVMAGVGALGFMIRRLARKRRG